jgi:hypothetical protein
MKKNQAHDLFGIEGVTDLFKEKETKGVAHISQFTFSTQKDPLYNLRIVRDGGSMFRMYDGDYVRLHVNGQLMMSDTAMERLSNESFIKNAKGRILIAGLGIGMVLKNILKNKEVTEIVVIEKYQDIIDLVQPKFNDSRLWIICADIFEYEMPKTELFDCIYFDIWAEISQDNLLEMKKLHSKYRKNLNKLSPYKYMDSWMKDYLKKEKSREQRQSRNNPWRSW